jgi:hypothetical protein
MTVVTVAWAHDYYSGHLTPLLESLPTGVHVVVVLASLGQLYHAVPQPPTTVTVVEVDISSCAHSDAHLLPDKVLYNIGLDLAPTDSVLVLPAGMELQTGDDAFTLLARYRRNGP